MVIILHTHIIHMGGAIYVAKGTNGKVKVYETHIKIIRSGLWQVIGSGGHGNKEIRIEDITGIEIAEGFIQFSERGFTNDEASLFSAPQDGNTVYFNWSKKSQFYELKELINDLRFTSGKEYICDECQNVITESDNFCPDCGTEVSTGRKCKECGEGLDGNEKFCPNCGTGVSTDRKCKECGEGLDGNEKFCPNCGTEFYWTRPGE
jgi:RNA polymerase subunit RPABC4/transcription elongation factor Spt4